MIEKKCLKKISVISIFLSLLISCDFNSDENIEDVYKWTSVGPYGGDIHSILVVNNDLIFAGSHTDGLFKTTDGGSNWNRIEKFNGNIIYNIRKNSTDDVFFGCKDGLYRFNVSDGEYIKISEEFCDQFIRTIYIDQNNNLYASAGLDSSPRSIYRSENNGTDWIEINNGIENTQVQSIISINDSTLYAGIYLNGLFKSSNNGDSWELVDAFPENYSSNYHALAQIGKKLFVIADDGHSESVYRSLDEGMSWEMIYDIADLCSNIISDGENLFLCSNTNGILISEDYGDTWKKYNFNLPDHYARCIDFLNNGNQLLANISGVYEKIQGSEHWEEKQFGITNTRVFSATNDLKNNSMIFRTSKGLFRLDTNSYVLDTLSTDCPVFIDMITTGTGKIFAATSRILTPSYDDNLYTFDESNNTWKLVRTFNSLISYLSHYRDDTILLGGGAGVFTYNWITDSLTLIYNNPIYGIYYNEMNDEIFIDDMYNLYISSNQGVSWNKLTIDIPEYTIFTFVANSDYILLTGENGLYSLNRNDLSMELIISGSDNKIFPGDKSLPNRYIYKNNEGIFLSIDYGRSWDQIYSSTLSYYKIIESYNKIFGLIFNYGIIVGERQ